MTPALGTQLLDKLAAAFASRDIEQLLALFSTRPDTTYAGSETDETATGPVQLRQLLTEILRRPHTYHFTFDTPRCALAGRALCVLADGTGTQTSHDRDPDTFRYRITGVLVPEQDTWVWLLLTGSEPTQPLTN